MSIGVDGGGFLVGMRPWGGLVRPVHLGIGRALVDYSVEATGMGVVVSAERVRPCVSGGGIHALHWNMLSWLELGCSRGLRGLRIRRAGRAVSGGCTLGFVRGDVACVVGGGSLGGLVAFCRRVFIWVGCLGIGSGLVWGRGMGGCLRSFEGKECWGGCGCDVRCLGGGGVFDVCFLREWEVLTVLRAWLVSSRTRQVTYVSISPVRA